VNDLAPVPATAARYRCGAMVIDAGLRQVFQGGCVSVVPPARAPGRAAEALSGHWHGTPLHRFGATCTALPREPMS
jgi:hypothetical protein